MMKGGTIDRPQSLRETLSAVGNLVLVVAERTGVKIDLIVSNSIHDYPSTQSIIEVAKSIIRRSS